MVSKTICVQKKNVYIYTFVLLLIFLFLGYYIYSKYKENYVIDYVSDYYLTKPVYSNSSNNKKDNDLTECKQNVLKLQSEITQRELLEKQCQKELFSIKQSKQQISNVYDMLSKNMGQMFSPNRQYLNPNDPTVYNTGIYQLVGYIYDSDIRYPLYGRYKDPGRSDRWEYYVIDETRNRLKIPFTTTNYKELFDGDTVDIQSLGNFTVKIYEIETVRYDPNVF